MARIGNRDATMGQLVKGYRKLKKTFPRLTSLISGYRLLFELNRTMGLLHAIQAVGSTSRETVNGKTAVVNMVRTYVAYQVCAELIFALKLWHRGYRVLVLYDDGVLVHHDTLTKTDFKPFRTIGLIRRKLSLAMLKRLPIIRDMLVPYSHYHATGTRLVADKARDWDDLARAEIDLVPFVEASLVRFYLSAPDRKLLKSEPDYSRALSMFVDNSLSSMAVARNVQAAESPDLCVTSHGIYTTWGVFFEYMKSQGVRCICYEANGYSINSVDLAINDVAASKSDGGYFEHLVASVAGNTEFQKEMFCKVDGLILSRSQGRASDMARFGVADNSTEHSEVKRIKQLKSDGKRVFGLFPNVMWDNATTFKRWNRVFESPVEWLIETVRFIERSPDLALVIRIHPAEHVWMPVRKSIRDILLAYLGDEVFTNDRIVIIESQTALPSYRLFQYLSAGLVYNGTIGPELICGGVPLIIGARAAYSDKGFTCDISGRDEYFEAFSQTDRILQLQNENMSLAKLFLFEYFFLHGVPVHFASSCRQFSPNYEGNSAEMWYDSNLDHIIDTMIGKKQFFQQHYELPVTAEVR